MSPFSQERVQWIEARLFCLARMAGELSSRRSYYASRLRLDDATSAFVTQDAYNAIQSERVQLMAERQVIEDYNRENGHGG